MEVFFLLPLSLTIVFLTSLPTRKSLKAERKLAKAKAKGDEELAEVLEQSRLEAERSAKELQALSSKPIVPTSLLVLGKQNLFMSDKHGNVHVTAPAVPCPFHPNDPFHKERASAAPCTADPNNPYTPFIEGREKLRKALERREREYPKCLTKCITIGLSDARKENPRFSSPSSPF